MKHKKNESEAPAEHKLADFKPRMNRGLVDLAKVSFAVADGPIESILKNVDEEIWFHDHGKMDAVRSTLMPVTELVYKDQFLQGDGRKDDNYVREEQGAFKHSTHFS